VRTMHLPELPVSAHSRDEYIELYLDRLAANKAPWPEAAMILTAYLAWPNRTERRNSFVATNLVRLGGPANETGHPLDTQRRMVPEMFGGVNAIASAAFDELSNEITQFQRQWLLVSDIFQLIVDMAFDQRAVLRRGASISKAVDLCEFEHRLPGHSQLRAAWSEFRDVAHLLAASAHLAHEGVGQAGSADKASILNSIWIAPDIVLAFAHGLQEFGLQPKSVRKESSILDPDKLWRVPTSHKAEEPFIVFRRLTEAQLAFLNSRRVAKKVA
jgi:hypothetical protein